MKITDLLKKTHTDVTSADAADFLDLLVVTRHESEGEF
jgi:hypothetical protein